MLSLILNDASVRMTLSHIIMSLLHAPFEITALLWLGALGLKGTSNFKNLKTGRGWSFKKFPSTKEFLFPVGLLFMAAIIETSLFALQV